MKQIFRRITLSVIIAIFVAAPLASIVPTNQAGAVTVPDNSGATVDPGVYFGVDPTKDSNALADQLARYKTISVLANCAVNDYNSSVSASDFINGNWFQTNNENAGTQIGNKGGYQDQVDCNAQLKSALPVWGLTVGTGDSKFLSFAKAAGWTMTGVQHKMCALYSRAPSPCITSPGPCPSEHIGSSCTESASNSSFLAPASNQDSLLVNAVDAQTGWGMGYTPYAPLYFGYYDAYTNFYSPNGACKPTAAPSGVQPGSDGKLNAAQQSAGYVIIYAADASSAPGTITARVVNYSHGKHFEFGGDQSLQGNPDIGYATAFAVTNPHSVNCDDIATYLGRKDNATNYLAMLPPSMFTSSSTPPTVGAGGQGGNQSQSTCDVPGIGWIICPVVNFLASVTDASYGLVSKLLTFDDSNTTTVKGTSSSLYMAWSGVRNIANIAFIIAFLVVIYSQITGAGISNYGIKKMLPRIIVAAILVNVSYWLCLIAVDLSNIVGSSMKSFLTNLGPNNFATGSGTGTSIWSKLAAGILIAGTLMFVGLSALIPALIIVLITIVVVMLVLVIRQALIILLIVVSPLAFVAYLLPNTEQWFKKWRELFQSMLLLYPIVGVIFGASALASSILAKQAAGDVVMSIIAALVGIVPLLLVPAAIKGAHSMFGAIHGAVNRRSGGLQDAAKKYRENRQDYRKLKALTGGRTFPGKGITARYGARRQAVLNNRKAELNRATTDYIADKASDSSRFRGQLAAGGGEGAGTRALAGAINAKQKLEADEITAARVVIENMNLTESQKADLANGGAVTSGNRSLSGLGPGAAQVRMAARQAVLDGGDAEQINRAIDGARSSLNANSVDGAKELSNFADALGRSSNKPSYVQPGDLIKMKQHGANGTDMGSSASMIEQALKDGVYSADKLTATGKQESGIVSAGAKQMVERGVMTAEETRAIESLKAAAVQATTDPRLSPRLGKQKTIVENLASGDTSKW